ncbi:Uncharacterised protein [BD1-7 clade bacterium]|uniref:Glycosyltransferase RgtA/B/C/D-like domain-containing protein n=1 Tax=BD1-7 clade bacterium TaxID=2029982 RepID=A0A5S9N1W0_9GAMM|nr:Uncharacterised protein [BD1-7 clade bacterium]CAA0083617.1 Uncharacterised protein [BD1-7 clade bacterium]
MDLCRAPVYTLFPLKPALLRAWIVLLVLVAGEVAVTLWLTGGTFIFTLDDPYIHLALAENIWQGHYGVNLSEASAPSSSVIWPLLLAPLSMLPAAGYAVLLMNVVLASGCLVFLARLLGQVEAERQAGAFSEKTRTGILVLAVLLANLVGLIFTGMEHLLQMLLALMIVSGLIEHVQTHKVPRWIWLAIVLLPLVRFESIVVAGAALLYLLFAGRALASIVTGVVIVACLAGYSAFLLSQGLSYLPDSVLAKADVAASGVSKLAFNLWRNLHSFKGPALLICALLFFHTAWFRSVSANKRRLMLAFGLAILGHLLAARMGWYFRYELYLWISTLALLFYLYCVPMLPDVSRGEKRFTKGLLITCAVFSGLEHTAAIATTPLAGANIYHQQYQMQRFLNEMWQKPVAVNDLGLTSFTNDEYVLDLWGLASSEARVRRKSATSPDWMAELGDKHQVEMAMIYHNAVWFETVPPQWQKVGELTVTGIPITAWFPVSIFATSASTHADILQRWQTFAETLPEGTRFDAEIPAQTQPR